MMAFLATREATFEEVPLPHGFGWVSEVRVNFDLYTDDWIIRDVSLKNERGVMVKTAVSPRTGVVSGAPLDAWKIYELIASDLIERINALPEVVAAADAERSQIVRENRMSNHEFL